MNNIYFFSGTGNSLKIAQDIAKGLPNVNVISIAKEINKEITSPIDCVGLVFPVHFGAPPPIVVDFIEKLKTIQINYIFAIATCNDFPGGTLYLTAKYFKKFGKKLNSSFVIHLPGNYIPKYSPLPKIKQQERFDKANEINKDILRIIKERKDTKISKLGWLFSIFPAILSNKRKMLSRDKDFWVNETCNNCGICQKICPVQNIEIVEGKPVWLHKCQLCFACLHWCPKEAIEFAKKTVGRARYQNPAVKLNNFLG